MVGWPSCLGPVERHHIVVAAHAQTPHLMTWKGRREGRGEAGVSLALSAHL